MHNHPMDAWANHAIAANGFADAAAPSIRSPLTRREAMQSTVSQADAKRYAKCVEVSKRIRWDIDRYVFSGREFDFT